MIHGCNDCWDTRNAVVVDTLDYDFSPGGLLNKVKDGKGNETNYLYDAVGRLSGIWAPNYGTISYRYDAGGRLKEKWLPNGVNTRYVYNADNTRTQAVNRATTASIISQHDYLYDAYANRRQQIEKNRRPQPHLWLHLRCPGSAVERQANHPAGCHQGRNL